VKIVGVDFTSAPTPRKAITIAVGKLDRGLVIESFLEFSDWPAYEQWLSAEDNWVGGFDFPFGLPKRFVDKQGWENNWSEMVEQCVRGGKARFVLEGMAAFTSAKTLEDKHRVTDMKVDSHSPLKTNTNPPVGKMFYEGSWRLLHHGIHIPRLYETGSAKIAVEAYPGYLAKHIGFRHYKNDKPSSAKKNRIARGNILRALYSGEHPLKVAVRLPSSLRARILKDGSGDMLDAVLCAVQAAWATTQPDYGVPRNVIGCEGWIVGARG
jgi:hypothetical protein